MSVFFPLKTFTNKKNVIPISTTDPSFKNNTAQNNARTGLSLFEREIIQKRISFNKNPVSYKKYKDDTDDIFKEAKTINTKITRSVATRSLYRGMLERVSISNSGCKKCGVR